jgi:sugar/nucleoside kinase (ribokinase family)
MGKKSKKAFYKAIEIAKKNKTKIAITLSDSFCVDRHRSDFIHLLNVSADIVFCNEDELKSLYQIEDIKKAKEFIDDSISCVACTCAERGAYLFHGSSISKISTNKIAVVDTTGAGDSFAAGFLYGLSKHFTFEKCAAFGNVIAGEVLKVYGPRVEKSLKNVVIN